jgi:hypothetical protein
VTPTPTARPLTLELSHGYRDLRSLAAQAGVAVRHEFRVSQKPYSSYEVVVDATSGDIGPGLVLRRIDAGGATLQESDGVGASGFARVLRWANDSPLVVESQRVRVQSGSCWTDCGGDDVYRVRAYDTTYAGARFNNANSQTAVVVLENPTSRPVSGQLHFWSASGVLIVSHPIAIAPNGSSTVPTAGIGALTGQSGTLTLTHNAGYGVLAGKIVALEPSTGFTFDTLLLPRAR